MIDWPPDSGCRQVRVCPHGPLWLRVASHIYIYDMVSKAYRIVNVTSTSSTRLTSCTERALIAIVQILLLSYTKDTDPKATPAMNCTAHLLVAAALLAHVHPCITT